MAIDPTTLAQGTGTFHKDIKETLEVPDTSKVKGSKFLRMITGKTKSVSSVDAAAHPIARMFSEERRYHKQKKEEEQTEEEQREAYNKAQRKVESNEKGVDYLA
jgi:hypothetical protein